MDIVNIAYICDSNYELPIYVSLVSLLKNKEVDTYYHIYIIISESEAMGKLKFSKFENEYTQITVIEQKLGELEELGRMVKKEICVASPSALIKFMLPSILNTCNRILYLDADTIIQKDLSQLYYTELGDNYLAAVVDSGSIYYKHKYVRSVENYFNTGVMVIDLERLRKCKITKLLIQNKKIIKDSILMDQDVFNVTFNRYVKLLPIKYNCMVVNLERAKEKYTIEELNKVYNTQYSNLTEVYQDATIVHFASKDKPWINKNVVLASEWIKYFEAYEKSIVVPKVTVIIPTYNVQNYISECLDSVLNQTLEEIEVICINDGSEDETLKKIEEYQKKDCRISIISKENEGQAIARNIGIRKATGKYIYFLDSDDYIETNALEVLYGIAEENNTDVLYFNGTCFYESSRLEKEFSQYKEYYKRRKSYEVVTTGCDMYIQMVINSDYKVSPCLQFIKREYLTHQEIYFHEGVIYEDNYFALMCMLKADRVMEIPSILFHRRVRESSTMTSYQHLRYFYGVYACVYDILQYISKDRPSRELTMILSRQLSNYIAKADELYEKLDANEKILADEYTSQNRIELELINYPIMQLKSISFYTMSLQQTCRAQRIKINELDKKLCEMKKKYEQKE